MLLLFMFMFTAFLPPTNIKIFLIGDSTMCLYDTTNNNPQRGWGQMLPQFFNSSATIVNAAAGGRSSKSFYEEAGKWNTVISQVQPGDYVFIQFAHNDQKDPVLYPGFHTDPGSTYDQYLTAYVNETRAKGGIPVLFTPVCRFYFDSNGLITASGQHNVVPYGDYPAAMRNVATTLNVPLIDLTVSTKAIYEAYGTASQALLHITADNTHPNILGATLMAQLASQEMKSKGVLTDYLTSSTDIILSPTSLSFGDLTINLTSTERSFSISGFNLTPSSSNITITAPADFEVSSTSGSGFASSIDIPYVNGTLATTTLYARFKPTIVQVYNASITASIGGTTLQSVSVTGQGTPVPQGLTAASVTWPLLSNQAPSAISGLLSATNQNPVNLAGILYNSTFGTVAGWQRVATTAPGLSYPSYSTSKYIEYTITPQPGYYFLLNSATFNALGGGTGGAKLAVYYSTDGWTTNNALGNASYNGSTYAATFATPVSLVNTGSANATVQGAAVISPSVTVKGGQTLSIRFYPWAGATNKYFTNKNVVLSGNTATASIPSAPVTAEATLVYATSATSGGSEISSDNNALVTAKGVCWNLSGSPTTGDAKTIDGTGTSAFISNITGLVPGLTYYARAYATNSAGTVYGNEITFTTSSTATEPILTTGAVTNIGTTTVSISGSINSDGGTALVASGFCWSSTNTSPTILDEKNNIGVNTGNISSDLTSLTPSTVYYIRAYATNNSALTGYGAVISFTTAGNFYNVAGSDVSNPANWGTNSDGTGSNPDFTEDNQVYHFINPGSAFTQNWTISSQSKLIVGNGTDAAGFTIPSDFYFSGLIDLSDQATLTVQNSANLVLGALHTNSTVNYDGSGSLTILSGSYGNLANTNDAGGTRTFSTGLISVAGSFSKGSASYTIPAAGTVNFNGSSPQIIPGLTYYNLQVNNAAGASITDSVVITSGGLLTVASGNLSVYGVLENKSSVNPVVTGTLTIKTNGSYRVNGGQFPTAVYESNSNVYVISGSPALVSTIGGNLIWTSNGSAGFGVTPVTIGGNFTMTAGTWAHGNGGVARTVIVQGNMDLSGGSYTIANTSVNTTTQTLTVLGNLTVSGGVLYASNNGTTGTNGTINVGGNLVHTGGVIGNGSNVTTILTGKIVFNGSTPQTIQTTGFTNNLNVVINNSTGVSLASDVTIDAALNLTSGVLSTGSQNLILNPTASIAGTPSASAMVYVNGSGQIRRIFTTTGSFTFPVGDAGNPAEYAPVTLNVSADAYSSAYVAVKTTREKHPNNGSVSDYLNRYWTVNSSGLTNPMYSGTFTYSAANVQGNESIIFGAHYNNATWENVGAVSVSSHSFTTPIFSTLGDFTCADGVVVPASPVITTSATGLAFGRVNRTTTSAELTYSITGYYLTPASGNITITAPSNFQISTTSGSGFGTSITLPYTEGTLAAQTIYVHFVAPNGTSATVCSGTLTNAGGGAVTQNISLSGTSIVSNADLGVNMVIAKDGSGDFTTIQAGINAIPASHPSISPYIVYIRPGFYHEKVTIPSTLSDIVVMGEDRDSTILDYTDYVGMSGTPNVPGTNAVQTLQVNASNITFKNMTIQDTVSIERAVAVNVGNYADKVTFRDCNIYGHQDTYYLWGSYRVYHNNCKITGSVDYIFGSATAVFDSCQLVINRNGGVITAASTPANFRFGLVFRNCTISTDTIGFDGVPVNTFYLGRPWNDNPKTVFLNCYEPSTLVPAGWTLMNSDPTASVNQNTLYAEYLCYGPGSAYTQRSVISGNPNYGRQLSLGESEAYTLSNIFAASSKTDIPFPNGDWFPAGGADLLPIELVAFTAVANKTSVTLNWKTATEISSSGFSVERKSADGNSWETIAFIQGAGNSNSPKEYSYTDKKVTSGKCSYHLKMIDNDGSFTYSQIVAVELSVPLEFSLSQNFPNPFNPNTVISYTLPSQSAVVLKVFNITGNEVATIVNAKQAAGYYNVSFNALNIAAGVYFYSLQTTFGTYTKKMILLK
ncbi:MAG: T9SS type A sorting domain-containing protein [Ignavibacteriales bacterium]|nr:T9SS type A sorting domain-containing protein [Ignavibacteriales bacterium]